MSQQCRSLRFAWLALAMAPAFAGCSGGLADMQLSRPKLLDFEAPRWAFFNTSPEEKRRPDITPADLVGPDGACPASDAPATPRAISLEMSECDVVRAAGMPERIDIRASAASERVVVLTYSKGQQPGIYEFVDGRLKVIERVPEPQRPQRQQRPPAKRKSA
jgi:hypothetical protein